MSIKISLDIGEIEVHHDYAKAVMHEGITVSPKHNTIILDLLETYFKNKPIVYIAHRINSYSVNPTIYLKTSKIPNLVGLAVVSNDPIQKKQVQLEKAFFSNPFRYFETMDDALAWKDDIIKNYNNSLVQLGQNRGSN